MFLFCEKIPLSFLKIIFSINYYTIRPPLHFSSRAPPRGSSRAPHFGNPSSSAMYSEAIFLSLKGNTHSSHIQSQRLRDRLKGIASLTWLEFDLCSSPYSTMPQHHNHFPIIPSSPRQRWSKQAKHRDKQTNKQTNRQTDKHINKLSHLTLVSTRRLTLTELWSLRSGSKSSGEEVRGRGPYLQHSLPEKHWHQRYYKHR